MFVSAPLRRRRARRSGSRVRGELADLEAARDAKYREIRDAELDHRTGKLSDADYEALDGTLRAEAIEILHSTRYHQRAMSDDPRRPPGLHLRCAGVPVLMHSGKDSGLSGAFGVGTGAGPFGGGSLVERNLNRWTVGFAIVFVVNTIILIKIS